ncbi:uncharacterized protein LOC125442021 [Sphaerodactylus townsendi]|uniref:uncharacterized protein LOC125442021 n=1 Tax=Sphaerodactylus townsendi TaxID=933632 RepID=UPI00202651C6|nr:uncharacterized protein LOC125442021 [Sphaerodactylus townsendi]
MQSEEPPRPSTSFSVAEVGSGAAFSEDVTMDTSEVVETEEDADLQTEFEKWRDVSSRFVDCVKILACQYLPYQGNGESFPLDDESGVGTVLELLNLLIRHDPVMKQHFGHVQSNLGSLPFLSTSIQNKFLHLMASAVRKSILRKICSAKYYGIMFDSVPDGALPDRLSEVVRYVEMDGASRKVHVRESFLGFIWLHEKDAESWTREIMRQLEKDELDLKDCRSQCYDNATVAGFRTVHQRITEKNHLALSINCDNRSLNLVGRHASSQAPKMGIFFANFDCLYEFFASSDERRAKLQEVVPFTLRSRSKTRWSTEVEAVKPVRMYLEGIIELLEDMAEDLEMDELSMYEASSLVKCLLDYEFLTFIGFWDKVLGRIDLVQRSLQNPSTNFHDAAQHLRSLRDYFEANRDILISESIDEGFGLCQKFDVPFKCPKRFRKATPGEQASDAELTAKEALESSMKAALDHLHRELNERSTRLHGLDTNFGFLLDVGKLCYGTDVQDLEEKCVNLGNVYSSDVDGQKLYQEILDCRMLLSGRDELRLSSPEQLLEFIQFGDESTFLNLAVATQILLIIGVSFATCERSSSKLKRILPYLSSSLEDQQRLCNLALLNVEREETEKTDFDGIIDRILEMRFC